MDGIHDCIKFLGKSICGWNIRKSDIEEIKEINSSYYYQYKDNMVYENIVVRVHNEVAKIFTKIVDSKKIML